MWPTAQVLLYLNRKQTKTPADKSQIRETYWVMSGTFTSWTNSLKVGGNDTCDISHSAAPVDYELARNIFYLNMLPSFYGETAGTLTMTDSCPRQLPCIISLGRNTEQNILSNTTRSLINVTFRCSHCQLSCKQSKVTIRTRECNVWHARHILLFDEKCSRNQYLSIWDHGGNKVPWNSTWHFRKRLYTNQ